MPRCRGDSGEFQPGACVLRWEVRAYATWRRTLAGKVFREPDDHVPVAQHEREMLRIASRDLTTAI